MRIAVIEDEEEYAKQLVDHLEMYATLMEFREGFEVKQFRSAEAFLDKYKPEYSIVFMDIALPGMDGMKAAKKLREVDDIVTLIFVTNLAKYAIKGYEVNALDFLVKPVKFSNFALKLKKAISVSRVNARKTLALSTSAGIAVISLENLKYVESNGHKLTYHLVDNNIEVRNTIANAEKQLQQYGFLRCNNSFLVNPRFINSVEGSIVWIGEEQIPISRAKRTPFIQQLTNWYMGGDR